MDSTAFRVGGTLLSFPTVARASQPVGYMITTRLGFGMEGTAEARADRFCVYSAFYPAPRSPALFSVLSAAGFFLFSAFILRSRLLSAFILRSAWGTA